MASSDAPRSKYHEGPDAAQRFDTTMQRLMTVSKDELAKREATYQKSRPAKKAQRAPK